MRIGVLLFTAGNPARWFVNPVDCTAAEGEWHSDSEIKIDKLGYVIRNGNKTKEFWDGCIRVDQQPLRLKIRNICGDETVWKV